MKRCPKCNKQLVPILYGMPTPEAMKKFENKELYLGGCEIYGAGETPKYYCYNCETKYFSNLTAFEDKDILIPDQIFLPDDGRYIFVQYYNKETKKFDGYSYNYKSDLDLKIGDYVEVERVNEKTIGIVKDIKYYTFDTAPYPYHKLKPIIRKLDSIEEIK